MPKGVLILRSYYEAIRDLPDADRLKMYDCMMSYGLCGEEPDLPVSLRGYFALIRPTMDNSIQRYLACCDNGKKGGRPRKNQSQNQRENLNKEKEKEYDTQKEWERDTRGGPCTGEMDFETKRAAALAALDRSPWGRL